MNFIERFFSFFQRSASELESEHEAFIRKAFKARCWHFKELLLANKKALESMASLEEALYGEQFFTMNFVREKSTAIVANVFIMAQELNALSNNAHVDLFDHLKDIEHRIVDVLTLKQTESGTCFVVPLKEVNFSQVYEVGGKMASLGEAWTHLGLTIPDGFVVTAAGYRYFLKKNTLEEEISRRLKVVDFTQLDSVFTVAASLQELIMNAPIPEKLHRAITMQVDKLGIAQARFAVRSSAVGEDSMDTAYAGQYASELNVRSEHLGEAYQRVVASKYSASAMIYRFDRGILDEEVPMCVGCLVMVDAVSGGVAYSSDPLNDSNHVIINSVFGLPKSVVEGTDVSDEFIVSRQAPLAILEQRVAEKKMSIRCHPDEGVTEFAVSAEEGCKPSLGNDAILEVAKIAMEIESFYGVPQDVEWAYAKDERFILLQSRPLSSRGGFFQSFEPVNGTILLSGGIRASSGAAVGIVYHARNDEDLVNFPQGGILVIEQAHSRWTSALRRASAVVADTGGSAGHLASVAREYGIPALFGVKGAFATLVEASEVSVDADGGKIYSGIVEGLHHLSRPRRLFLNSSVYNILGSVVEHIVPLHLLEPESLEFTPSYCKTLHDIIRYCHEKAVNQMFHFNEDIFNKRCGKQLRYKGEKLQYYIINIDQGFCKEIEGRYVDMEQICCRSMHFLWSGMIAVPWEFPASTSARGLFSILAESACNPELEITHSSTRLARNYFLVDKDFFNLQASFGYHFCSVEAQAGDLSQENYISFHFKGGAANLSRRKLRVLAIGDVLIEKGFIVEIKEDTLFARIEDIQQEKAYSLLTILGFLLIHSRQMDAALSGEDSRIAFANQLRKGIITTQQICGINEQY